MNQPGGTSLPAANASWGQEIALDLDMVSASCPLCKILLVEATSPSTANLGVRADAYRHAVAGGDHPVDGHHGDAVVLPAHRLGRERYSNLNKATGYVRHSVNVAAYKGQALTLEFTGTEDSSLQTSFVLDDTALNYS